MVVKMNRNWWIYATNYFLFFGAAVNIMMFTIQIITTYCDASPTEIGMMFTFIPIVTTLVKPALCSLADKYLIHKQLLVGLMMIMFICFTSLLLLPYGGFSRATNWHILATGIVIGNSIATVIIAITDTLAIIHVKKHSWSFGPLRVFATFGWGLISPIIGLIGPEMTFLPKLVPNILAFDILFAIDLFLIIHYLKPETEKRSSDLKVAGDNVKVPLWPKLKILFRKHLAIYQHLSVVTLVGILSGLQWTFLPLFVEKLTEKPQSLIGLMGLFSCIFGEIPIFMLADRIIAKVGSANAFSISLLAFAVRYLAYAYLITPKILYFILVVELTQGLTFGLFFPTMALTASSYAAKTKRGDEQHSTIETTMQGIFGGCFDGPGIGIGAFLGGITIDKAGFTDTWALFGSTALVAAALNFTISKISNYKNLRSGS